MVFMARTQVSTAANPLIVFIYQDPVTALMKDVTALAYEVFDISTPAKEITPTVKVARTALVLANAKLSSGRYFAPVAPLQAWGLGDYRVVWYYTVDGGTEQTMTTPLHVTDEAHGPPSYYATVQDVYDSGLSTDEYTVKQVRAALAKASAQLETWTGRRFRAEYRAVKVDGGGGMKVRLREPVIAVESIELEDESLSYTTLLDWEYNIHIYNRHIRLGQLSPDDRINPRLEYANSLRPMGADGYFGDGSQDIKVTGVFGYTEPNGSPTGGTPAIVRDLTVAVALLSVDGAASPDSWKTKNKWKLTEERTRDQTVKYGGGGSQNGSMYVGPGSTAYFTGEPDLDAAILRLKVGPGMMGG